MILLGGWSLAKAAAAKCLESRVCRQGLGNRRRVDAELVAAELRSIGKDFISLASGVPIREAWQRGVGAVFVDAVRDLVDHPDCDTVARMRSALYSGALAKLIECWQTALAQQEEIAQLETKLSSIPRASDRIAEWWDERPEDALVLKVRTEDWPDLGDALARVADVRSLCGEWDEFHSSYEPMMNQKSREELRGPLTSSSKQRACCLRTHRSGWMRVLAIQTDRV